MGVTAVLSGIALLLQFIGLPSMPADAGNSLGDMARILKRHGVRIDMVAIILLMTGSLYMRPFLQEVSGPSTGMIALVLAGFNAAAVAGTVTGGKLADIDEVRALAATGGMALAALALVL